MKINIRGKTKSMCKAEVIFASRFFARYLMSERLLKNIEVDILFDVRGRNAEGYCGPIDSEYRPRMFEIGVNPKLPRYKMLQCLAHEFVHLKQYAKRELVPGNKTAKFNGVAYKEAKTFEDYLNSPWEIEAYGRDRALYLFYHAALKQGKIKFKNGRAYSGKHLLKNNH